MNCTSFEEWLIERGEEQPAGEALARLELPSAAASHLAGCSTCRHIWEEELLLDQVIPVWRERVPVTAEFGSRVLGRFPGLHSQNEPAVEHNPAAQHLRSGSKHSSSLTHIPLQSAHSPAARSRPLHSHTPVWGRFAAVGLAALVLVTFGRSAWLGLSPSATVVTVQTKTSPSGLAPSRVERSTSTPSPAGKSATSVARGAVSSGAVDIPYSLAWAASDVHETYRQFAQETSAVLDDIVEPPDLQTMAPNWTVWSVARQTDSSVMPAAAPSVPGLPPQIDLSDASASVRTRSLATGWAKAFDFVFEALPETPPLEES